MGQAKQKMSVTQSGRQSVAVKTPFGDAPPQVTRGERNGNFTGSSGSENDQSVTDRQRVNISVPEGVYSALVGISKKSGVSVSQAALLSLLAGLPALAGQIQSIELLKK